MSSKWGGKKGDFPPLGLEEQAYTVCPGNTPKTAWKGKTGLPWESGPWGSRAKAPGRCLYVSVSFLLRTPQEIGGEICVYFNPTKEH